MSLILLSKKFSSPAISFRIELKYLVEINKELANYPLLGVIVIFIVYRIIRLELKDYKKLSIYSNDSLPLSKSGFISIGIPDN